MARLVLFCLISETESRELHRFPGADQMRIGSLLACHDPQDPRPADPGLPKPLPTQPEAPWWQETLEALSDNPPGRKIIAYLDHLKLVFGNHLEQCANNSGKEKFYQEHRCFFQQVLDTEALLIPPYSKLLTDWITEADLIDLRALFSNAVPGANPEVFDKIKKKALDLERAGYRDNEDVTAARALADKYKEWRGLFERCLRQIAEFKPQTQRHYPWLAGPASAEDYIYLFPQELQELRQGLDAYGAQQDVAQYAATLMGLQTRLLQALDAGDSSTAAPVDPVVAVVLAMWSARKAWAPALGDWPESEEWDAAQACREQALARYSTAVLEELRGDCADWTRLEAILNDHRIKSLKELALPEVSNFQDDIGLMMRLHQKLEDWRKQGSGVPSESLANAAEDIAKLKGSWDRTACFEALDAGYADLRRELATLKEARGFYDAKNFEQAVRLLSSSKLQAAVCLRADARRLAADQGYINQLHSEGHEALAPEELAGAGAEVKDLRERLRKGHEFFDPFDKQAASIRWANGFAAAAREAIGLLSTEIPDDAELKADEGLAFARRKDELREALDCQAISFHTDLVRRVKPFPLPGESVLAELETELEGFYGICDLPLMESGLAEYWRPSVKAVALILKVQRAAFKADWQRAKQLLDEPQAEENLNRRQQAQLRALLAVQALKTQKPPAKTAGNADWLALYAAWGTILFDYGEYRKRYLDLLRRSTGIELKDHHHPGLLQADCFCEEQELRVLVAAFANPPILHDLPSLTESKNTPLVGRLLPWLVKDLENYSAVRKLWDLLTESESMSKAVWSQRESPVDKMRQRIEAEQKDMDARLLDPAVPISDLQDLIDRHERSGVVCKKARYKIKRASAHQRLAGSNRSA